MAQTVEEFFREHNGPLPVGRKNRNGFYPVDKNSAEYQDYLVECEKIEKQQAAERKQEEQKRFDKEFADSHDTPEHYQEFDDLPHNQNRVSEASIDAGDKAVFTFFILVLVGMATFVLLYIIPNYGA